jgi:hypothetical protein
MTWRATASRHVSDGLAQEGLMDGDLDHRLAPHARQRKHHLLPTWTRTDQSWEGCEYGVSGEAELMAHDTM